MFSRIRYRVRQFCVALRAAPGPEDIKLIQATLTQAQMTLFLRMQAGEQAHSLQVFKKLSSQALAGMESARADLLVAALLHDVGKSRYPLNVWERVVIVLAKLFIPKQVKTWGRVPSGEKDASPLGASGWGWKRAFLVAGQHPTWGAEMAEAVGASPLAVALIRRHQEPVGAPVTLEEQLLQQLQLADDSY